MCNNKDLIVLHPDQGSATVILNRDQYIMSLFDIINDTSKFKKLPADLTLIREGKLQSFFGKLKINNFFTKEIYDNTFPSGWKPASVYGLPKIHKLHVQRINLSLRRMCIPSGPTNINSLSSLLIFLFLLFLYLMVQKWICVL